jgi:hypothetical protein
VWIAPSTSLLGTMFSTCPPWVGAGPWATQVPLVGAAEGSAIPDGAAAGADGAPRAWAGAAGTPASSIGS